MSEDIYKYDMLWRPNYELSQTITWVGAGALSVVLPTFTVMPQEAGFHVTALCAAMAGLRAINAVKNHYRVSLLRKWKLDLIGHKEHAKFVKNEPNSLWIGYGFDWETRQAQLAHDLIKANPVNFIQPDPKSMGAQWYHGLGKERPLYVPLEHLEGHTLLVGTTGSGKTRILDIIGSAAARRNRKGIGKEFVVVIDPKGDKELRDGLRKVCAEMGEPERFVYFHPAFPELSVRLNPLASFTRAPELATRLAQLIDASGSGETFKNFAQMAMTHIVTGLIQSGITPTIYQIKKYIELGPEGLVIKSLEAHFEHNLEDGWRESAEKYVKTVSGQIKNISKTEARAHGLVTFYRTDVADSNPNPDIEGLLSMFEHERQHFSKMITSITPILTMLTSGDLGPLLSPRPQDDDDRLITSFSDLIRRRAVVYIGLDSLSDSIVGSALGSILLADLASVAGARYNYDIDTDVKINLITDESAEIVNPPAVQILNKGRGSGIQMTIATQTYADFANRLGSEAAARQVLANCNNVIALRVMDTETQQYIADGIPKTRIKFKMQVHGTATTGEEPLLFTGNASERLMEEEAPLFSAEWLGCLPNLHYIAKVSGGRILKGRLPVLTHGVSDKKEYESGDVVTGVTA